MTELTLSSAPYQSTVVPLCNKFTPPIVQCQEHDTAKHLLLPILSHDALRLPPRVLRLRRSRRPQLDVAVDACASNAVLS